MSAPDREQRLVFGEIAEQYDKYRPSYPDALFDAIVEFGALHPGDRALEIGAGTGKATAGFLARGLDVLALEPSAGMAAVLRAKGVDTQESQFESWTPPAGGFRLVYAAQAWHWIHGDDRYERVARALATGGTVALFWNKGREWTGQLGADNDAVYAQIAPALIGGGQWPLDWVLEDLAGCADLEPPTKRVVTWSRSYTSEEWVRLLGTNSNHRLLPDEQRSRLQAAVGDVIDRHGGRVDMIYDAEIFLSRRV